MISFQSLCILRRWQCSGLPLVLTSSDNEGKHVKLDVRVKVRWADIEDLLLERLELPGTIELFDIRHANLSSLQSAKENVHIRFVDGRIMLLRVELGRRWLTRLPGVSAWRNKY